MNDSISVGKDWAKHYRLPGAGNMMERHENREQVFINQGTRIVDALISCMRKYCGSREIGSLRILDFGCGVGRVVLPLFYNFRKPDNCIDVDSSVIEYLKEVVPDAHPEVGGFDPPTRFSDSEFDLVYAISVWTHLPAGASQDWLFEMKRILKPGGLALLTTSNYAVLQKRRLHPVLGPLGWKDVKDADLQEQGFIFKATPSTPGTGLYGMASHDPAWVRREWSRCMPVVGIESGAILGVQDINVLRRT